MHQIMGKVTNNEALWTVLWMQDPSKTGPYLDVDGEDSNEGLGSQTFCVVKTVFRKN